MPCAQRVSGNRRIRGARLGRRLVSGAPLSPKGFGARGLLTFDNRVFSMQPRKGTGLRGPVPRGGFPLLGKEAPLNRKELVDAIQKHTEVARGDVDKVLGSLIQHTQVAVKKGGRASPARPPRRSCLPRGPPGPRPPAPATARPLPRHRPAGGLPVAAAGPRPQRGPAPASASPAQRRRPRGTRGAVAHARTEAGPQSGSVRMFR